jgi:methylenetetrahydrofolate dehydrogenase (NADP+) / methenyltetrahydrofolate cyclohydrolase
MSAVVISGLDVANNIKQQLAKQVDELVRQGKPRPQLVVILVGNHPASISYVTKKEKDAVEIGFLSEIRRLDESVSEADLLREIERCNDDPSIHGILVQLPLPHHIDKTKVLDRIEPSKDVDGFHPINIGRLHTDQDSFVPCTPKGIMTLIESTGIQISGKNAVVMGRSNIVGKPVAMLLLQANATVTIVHSQTQHPKEICQQADILVAAVGRAEMVKADWVKPGAVVIDVGVNRVGVYDNGKAKLVGDVDYEAVKEVAGFITPVPGGVGPMTIASLLENTLKAYKKSE